jgi:hypothetical protein
MAVDRDAEHLSLHTAVEALHHAIIRHDARGTCLVWLFCLRSCPMVSPSGTRGTGSTKVRAGRRKTLG